MGGRALDALELAVDGNILAEHKLRTQLTHTSELLAIKTNLLEQADVVAAEARRRRKVVESENLQLRTLLQTHEQRLHALEPLTAEVTSLRLAHNELRITCETHQQALSESKHLLATLERGKADAENRHGTLQNAYGELEVQCRRMRHDAEQREAGLRVQFDDLNAGFQRLTSEHDQLSRRADGTADELRLRTEECASLRQSLATQKDRERTLTTVCQESERVIERLQTELIGSRRQVADQATAMTNLETALAAARAELEGARERERLLAVQARQQEEQRQRLAHVTALIHDLSGPSAAAVSEVSAVDIGILQSAMRAPKT